MWTRPDCAPRRMADLELVDVVKVLNESGIASEKLDQCAHFIYEWERGDEPDARLVVIKIARVLADAS